MLRDPSFVSEIPEEKKAVFVEDDGTGKLQILKDKLKERFPVSTSLNFKKVSGLQKQRLPIANLK